MKVKNLFLGLSTFTLLIFIGCSTEVKNIATSPDGVEISFDVQGSGYPAIIFIHGWSNNRSIWDAQVSHFSEKYKVVNIDLPGFGQSGNNRQVWSIKAYAKDVAAVIEKLDLDQVVVVGFSLGASVAIETANAVPENVMGVVLVDDLHNVELTLPPPVISYLENMMMDLVLNPTKEKMIEGGFIKKNPETSYTRVLTMIEDVSTIGWRESLLGYAQWINEDKIPSLQKCKTPILAINTNSEPTNEDAFKKYVPTFHARIVPDVGHVIMWDAPDTFNGLLEECIQEFLSTNN